MPLSEYARSEYEEDSEFVMSDEEDDTGPQNPPDIESHHDPPESPPIDKPRLEVLEDSLSNTSQNSPNRNGTQMESAPSSIISNDASKFINHVDLVMNKIKTLQSDNRWNRVLKHRTGVQVSMFFDQGKGKKKVLNILSLPICLATQVLIRSAF